MNSSTTTISSITITAPPIQAPAYLPYLTLFQLLCTMALHSVVVVCNTHLLWIASSQSSQTLSTLTTINPNLYIGISSGTGSHTS